MINYYCPKKIVSYLFSGQSQKDVLVYQVRSFVLLMKEYAEKFYSSKAWQHTRQAYKKSVGGLCEVCFEKGIYKAGHIVHHKVHITPDNINDPFITLNWDNLQLVCRECHEAIHTRKKKRYKIDELGRVTGLE